MNETPNLRRYTRQWHTAQLAMLVTMAVISASSVVVFALTAGATALNSFMYPAAAFLTVLILTTFYITMRLFVGNFLEPEHLYETLSVSGKEASTNRPKEVIPVAMVVVLRITEVLVSLAVTVVLVGGGALFGLGFRAGAFFGPEVVFAIVGILVGVGVLARRTVWVGILFIHNIFKGNAIVTYAQSDRWSKHHA